MLIVDTEINPPVRLGFQAAIAATKDAQARDREAAEDHAEFFADPDHIARVEAVTNIVNSFFTVKKAVYINRRGIRRAPFTAVKVEKPNFPNGLTQAQKDATFYAPLRALNVQIVFSKSTNSYLFRIA